ncbi:phosphatidylglycerophosphatase A [Cloacibacillus sp. An23]|uniref:phosphatidylglycerophosphatase A family protein n=1 Tax=Cloacibacillus sp. An23 TaxID=1965591 RepID=UPI000B3706A1|nr:phosphatidylglycerophosphatase A [Cloacibacillus sp. An23]OUO93672.1 phosphatidylglycerophosphatase A [Cloacibacillus sp. An23]
MILIPEMKTWYGLVATVGTIGRFSRMPGTIGSVAGCAVWMLAGGVPLWLIAAVAALGCVAAGKYEKAAERDDPGEVVIDEVVGVWLASWGFDMSYAVPALFLFRIIDIVKPFPVSRFDKIPGGVGIMADDIAGGIIVNLLMRFIHWLLFEEGLTAILTAIGR